jgi:uncharacterized protein YqhQ
MSHDKIEAEHEIKELNMIRGMSYPKGIFYLNEDYIAHATVDSNGEIITELFAYDHKGLFFVLKRILLTIPWYVMLILGATLYLAIQLPGIPFYLLLAVLFSYHFFFPYPMRQFHGAEHKVFSHQGKKSIRQIEPVAQATIINRHCSTNAVVAFFLLFIVLWYPLGGNAAAVIALLGVLLRRWLPKVEERLIFPLSAKIQLHISTAEPCRLHLKVALLSYLSLQHQQAVTEQWLLEEEKQQELEHAEAEARQRIQALQEKSRQIIEETQWSEM